jgi:hypothetical protein
MWPLQHKTKERQTMNQQGRPQQTGYRLSAIGYRLIFCALIASMSWQAQACMFFDGFRDNLDGTVTDPRNNLVWQCVEGTKWNGGRCIGKAASLTWIDAMHAAKKNRFLQKDDWRCRLKKR